MSELGPHEFNPGNDEDEEVTDEYTPPYPGTPVETDTSEYAPKTEEEDTKPYETASAWDADQDLVGPASDPDLAEDLPAGVLLSEPPIDEDDTRFFTPLTPDQIAGREPLNIEPATRSMLLEISSEFSLRRTLWAESLIQDFMRALSLSDTFSPDFEKVLLQFCDAIAGSETILDFRALAKLSPSSNVDTVQQFILAKREDLDAELQTMLAHQLEDKGIPAATRRLTDQELVLNRPRLMKMIKNVLESWEFDRYSEGDDEDLE